MKKLGFFISFTFLCAFALQAQDKFMTKVGHIHFYSHAKIEDIKADNNEVTSIINIKTGEMAFVVLMKSFKFDKALMEEHFNENYIESDKFPKAKFKGNITNFTAIDLTKDAKYDITVEGDLEIHGITKHVTEKGTLEVSKGKINAKSVFTLAIKDFGIAIETALSDNIAENIEVTVEMLYEPMQ